MYLRKIKIFSILIIGLFIGTFFLPSLSGYDEKDNLNHDLSNIPISLNLKTKSERCGLLNQNSFEKLLQMSRGKPIISSSNNNNKKTSLTTKKYWHILGK